MRWVLDAVCAALLHQCESRAYLLAGQPGVTGCLPPFSPPFLTLELVARFNQLCQDNRRLGAH